jgi:hypothetical protein
MQNLLVTIKNKNYLGLINNYKMDLHKSLHDQLMKAIADYEDAKELEELSKRHREINGELKSKVDAALQKDQLGQTVSDAEQSEIDSLAKQQEETYRKMADKILKK